MKNYTPRAGSVPAQVLAHLESVQSAVNTTDLAAALGLEGKSIQPSMKAAIAAGLVHCERAGRDIMWHLGPSSEELSVFAPEDASEEPEPFACGLYNDGELILLHAGEDGSVDVTLTKAQADVLRAYFLRWETGSAPA